MGIWVFGIELGCSSSDFDVSQVGCRGCFDEIICFFLSGTTKILEEKNYSIFEMI